MAPKKKATKATVKASSSRSREQQESGSSAASSARSNSTNSVHHQQQNQPEMPIKKHARMTTGPLQPKKPLINKHARKTEGAVGKPSRARTTSRSSGDGGEQLQKHRKKRPGNRAFRTYIYKVLQTVNGNKGQGDLNLGISNNAMNVMNSFCLDLFHRFATESTHLCQIKKKQTLSAHDVQSAIKLLLPGEIRAHAINEGEKALKKWKSS